MSKLNDKYSAFEIKAFDVLDSRVQITRGNALDRVQVVRCTPFFSDSETEETFPNKKEAQKYIEQYLAQYERDNIDAQMKNLKNLKKKLTAKKMRKRKKLYAWEKKNGNQTSR
jgi:hypothetical protein